MKKTGRRFLERLYDAAPYPLSAWMYAAGRATWLKDSRDATFRKAFAHLARHDVAGDYLEFGCYRGASIAMSWRLARHYRFSKMRLFAFDSFEGLPTSEGSLYKEGAYSCSLETFRQHVRKAGVDSSRLIPVPGFYSEKLFQETKRRHGLKRAALVHIDCNLYSSAQIVFPFLNDLIDINTVIIVDDWYRTGKNDTEDQVGVRRAFREWKHSDEFVCVDAAEVESSAGRGLPKPDPPKWGDNKMFVVQRRPPISG